MNEKENKSGSQDNLEGEASAIDLTALFHTIRKKWWLVLGSIILTLSVGGLYILRTPKTYESETVVQVEQSETKIMNIQDLTTEDLKTQEILKTIEQNLTGSQVLLNVLDKLKLSDKALGLTPSPDQPLTQQDYLAALQNMVSAKLERGTRLISIKADNTDPKLAQSIASAVVSEYIATDTAQKLGISGEANQFLLEESDRLKSALSDAEQAAQAFKDAHPDVPLDDSQNFIDQKLLSLTQNVNNANQLRIKLESDLAQIQKFKQNLAGDAQIQALLTVGSVNSDPAVLQLQKSISDEEATFATLKQRYLPKHPKYIQEVSRLSGLHDSLNRAVFNAADSVSTTLDSALASEKKTEQLMQEQSLSKLKNDRLTIPYSSLAREVQRNLDLYDAVQTRLKETALTSGMDDNKIRIITPALLPISPVKPKPALVLAAALFGGVLMGFCLCFAFSLTDTSLKTLDQAENALGLPAVGAIPLGSKLQSVQTGIPILQEPHSALAEAFRTLRTALSLLGDETNFRSFLFTSGVPGEGKSFCSVNYAISLAQLGKKTLLVDADLRLPVLEPLFFSEPKEKGLSTLLEGTCKLDEAIYPTEIPNLYLLPSGKRAQNPAELLANSNVPALVKKILTQFERVVIDSAPVHAVSDTLLIVRHVSAVCLVVHAAQTPLNVVKKAIQKLADASGKPAGFILNRLPQNSAGYYYHYSGGTYGKDVYGGPDAYAGNTVAQESEKKPRANKKTIASTESTIEETTGEVITAITSESDTSNAKSKA